MMSLSMNPSRPGVEPITTMPYGRRAAVQGGRIRAAVPRRPPLLSARGRRCSSATLLEITSFPRAKILGKS